MRAEKVTGAARAAWFGGALVILALLGVVVFHSMPRSDRVWLAPSAPDETVLRALRLAGVEHASAGAAEERALSFLEVPAISSVPDVEIAWQAAFATLSSAYPDAGGYTVVLEGDGTPLVRLDGDGADVRDAVAADDAVALRRAIAPQLLLPEDDVSAEGLLAVGEERPGGYLDAKNRAAGLLDESGPATGSAAALADAASAMRRDAPGVAATGPGERAVDLYRERLRSALAAEPIAGGAELLEQAGALGPDPGRGEVARLRSRTLVAEALVASPGSQGLLRDAYELAGVVASASLASGPLSDAVLAAADAERAPDDAVDVRAFERVAGSDFRVDGAPGDSLPARVLRLHGEGSPPGVRWATAEGRGSAAPSEWLAYQRADGTLFWLAGQDGEVALTESSIRGWAFTRHRAAVVDALRCGRVVAQLPLD